MSEVPLYLRCVPYPSKRFQPTPQESAMISKVILKKAFEKLLLSMEFTHGLIKLVIVTHLCSKFP